MSDAYLGEIRIFSGNYAPVNWHICDGTQLNVQTYQTLFALIGTIYGGNGTTTFAVPDLRGRVPVGQGQGTNLSNYNLGQNGGTETVTLTTANMPAHTHSWQSSTGDGNTNTPGSTVMLAKPAGTTTPYTMYRKPDESGLITTAGPADMISATGGNAPHDNMMPSTALNYIICVAGGAFPQRAQ